MIGTLLLRTKAEDAATQQIHVLQRSDEAAPTASPTPQRYSGTVQFSCLMFKEKKNKTWLTSSAYHLMKLNNLNQQHSTDKSQGSKYIKDLWILLYMHTCTFRTFHDLASIFNFSPEMCFMSKMHQIYAWCVLIFCNSKVFLIKLYLEWKIKANRICVLSTLQDAQTLNVFKYSKVKKITSLIMFWGHVLLPVGQLQKIEAERKMLKIGCSTPQSQMGKAGK